MGIFTQAGPYYNHPYKFESKGDTPTPDELDFAIAKAREYDYIVRERERAAGKERPSDAPTLGIGMGLGPLIGGVARGTAGIAQGALAVSSPSIPQFIEEPIARALSSFAESGTPQTLDQPGFGYQLSETVGGMVPVVGTSILAGLATGGTGGFATAAGLSGLQGAGEAYERARAKGAEDTLAGYGAVLGGGAVGATVGALPVGRMLRPLAASPVTSKLVTKMPGLRRTIESSPSIVKSAALRAQRALRTGGEEAVSEVIENTLQNLMAMGYDPESEPFAGTQEAATMGGAAGAAMQILADLIVPGRLRSAPPGLPAPDASGPPPGEPVPNTAVDFYDIAGRHRQAYEDASAAHASSIERVKKTQVARNKAKVAHANNPTEATRAALDQAAAELTGAIEAATTYERAASSALSAMEAAAAQARKQGQNIRPVTGLLPAPTAQLGSPAPTPTPPTAVDRAYLGEEIAPAEPSALTNEYGVTPTEIGLAQLRAAGVESLEPGSYAEAPEVEMLRRRAAGSRAVRQGYASRAQAALNHAKAKKAEATRERKAAEAAVKQAQTDAEKKRADAVLKRKQTKEINAERALQNVQRRYVNRNLRLQNRVAAEEQALAQPTPRETLTLKGRKPTPTPAPAPEPTPTAEPVDFSNPVSYNRYGFTHNSSAAGRLKAAGTPEERKEAVRTGLKAKLAAKLDASKESADKLDAVRDGVRQAHEDLGYTDSPQLAQALEGIPAEDKDRLLTAARIGELGIKPGGKIPGGGALRLNALIDAVNDNPTDPIGAIANSESAKAYVENANFSPEFKALVKSEPTVETPTAPTADTTPETSSAEPEVAKTPAEPEVAKTPAEPEVVKTPAEPEEELTPPPTATPAQRARNKQTRMDEIREQATMHGNKVASTTAAKTGRSAPGEAKARAKIHKALTRQGAGLNVEAAETTLTPEVFAQRILSLVPANVSPALHRATKKLAAAIKASNIRVEIINDLPSVLGVDADGMYDPEENVIYLDGLTGLDAHIVLHEATHAVTAQAIRNGDAALVDPIREIYNDVKATGKLVGEPGMDSLEEFVAEVLSNRSFRDKVAAAQQTGTDVNPITRLAETLQSFFKRGTPPRGTDAELLAAAEALIAPNLEAIGGDRLYHLKTPQQFAAQPKEYRKRDQRAVAAQTKAGYVDQVKDDLMNKVPRSGIYTALGFFPLDTVRRLGKHIPGVEALSSAITSMETYVSHLNDRAHVVERAMVALSKLNRADFDALGAKMTQDTSAQIDSSLTPKQAQKFYGGDPKKLALYKKYRAEYEALSKPAQQLYVQTKEYFRRTFDDLLKVMKASVDTDLVGSPDAAKAIKDSMEKMFKKSVAIHPYFPLFRRDGDYLLMWTEKVTDPVDGTVSQEPVSLKFTTAKMRDAALADLMALESRTPGSVFNVKSVMRNDVAEAFVRPTTGGMTISQIMGVMDTEINKLATNKKLSPEQKVKAEAEAQRVKTQLANTLIDLLPETAIARSLKKRGGADGEGVLGAETMDMIAAFKSKSGGLNRSIAQRRFFNQVEKAKVGLTQHFGVTDTAALAEAPMEPGSPAKDSLATKRAALERAIARDLLRRAELATSVGPSVDKAARRVNQFTFMYMLTSPATSLINLSTIPAIAAPVLGGKYGFSKSWVELMRASRLFTESYGDRTVLAPSGEAGIQEQFTVGESVFDREFSLDNFFDLDEQGNYTVRDKYVQRFKDNPKKLRELQELAPLLTVLEGAGQMRRSTLSEAVLEDDTSQRMNTAMKMLIAPFHMTEQLGRQATAVAAYRLELKRLRDNPPEGVTDAQMQAMAAETALGHALEVNGGAGIHTAPRYAQRGIGRMAFLFKSWALSQVALQARMSFDMFKLIRHQVGLGKLSPEDLAAAKIGVKQMMLMHASIGVMAGAAGMPIYGLIESMYDLLHGDDEEDFGTVAQNYIDNDVIHKGIFTLLGVDVSDRMGLSHLLYRDNPYMSDASVEEHLVALAAGPSWSIAKQAYQASRDFREGNYQRSLEGISPTPLKNLLKAFRIGYAEDGYQTRTGNPIYEDVSAGDVAAQLLGFMPLEYSKVQTQNQFVYRWDKNIREQRERLSKKLYFELYHGGGHDVASVMRKIEKFNRKFPHAAIDSDYLKSSFKKRAETEAKMINGLSVSDLNRDALQYYSLISNAAIR